MRCVYNYAMDSKQKMSYSEVIITKLQKLRPGSEIMEIIDCRV